MQLPEYIKEVEAKATCLYTKNEVEAAFDRMAKEITDKLEKTNPLILCVMIGGMIPTASLLQRLNFPIELDYIHATRYHGNTRGDELYWKVVPSTPLEGRTVLVVDDILDGGITLAAILEYCRREKAENVYSAVLVDKKVSRDPGGEQYADFVGLDVEDGYLYGCGMDYKEYLRNVHGIYAIADEHK